MKGCEDCEALRKRVDALEKFVRRLKRDIYPSWVGEDGGKPCHYARDHKGRRFWLPGCMGGAVYGDKDHCTCRPPMISRIG